MLQRVETQKRTLQWQLEEFKTSLMTHNRKSQLISQISSKYGNKKIRESTIWEESSTDKTEIQMKSEEEQIQTVLNSVRQEEFDDLNNKLEAMKKRMTQIQEDNKKLLQEKQKLIEQMKSKQSKQMSQSQIEQLKQNVDVVDDLDNDIGTVRMPTGNFSSIIQIEKQVDEKSSVYKSLQKAQQYTQEEEEQNKKPVVVDTKKDQQIQRLNKLLKQMAENRRSRLPTVVRKQFPRGSIQPRATQFTNRFSAINFKIPSNFDFLGYSRYSSTQNKQMNEAITQAIEDKGWQKANLFLRNGCPQFIKKHLIQKEHEMMLFQNKPVFFSSYGQILNSSLKVEHEVIIIITQSKIYYFQKKKQKFIRSQSLSKKTSLIVISKFSQAMVVLAHWGNQPEKELHLVIQTPYRTQLILFFSQLFEKQWKKRLIISVKSGSKKQKQQTVSFENKKLGKFHFLNALQKGFLEIFRKKKLFKSAKWKEHFCVLSNSATSAEDNLSLIPTIDYPIENQTKGFEGKKFVFSISSGEAGEKLYFACKSNKDLQNWLNSFKKLQRDFNNMKNQFISPTMKK